MSAAALATARRSLDAWLFPDAALLRCERQTIWTARPLSIRLLATLASYPSPTPFRRGLQSSQRLPDQAEVRGADCGFAILI